MPVLPTTQSTSTSASRAPLPMLSLGSKGPNVLALQKALLAAGFNPQGLDGEFGPKTLAALKAFQKAAKIEVDGIAGPQTWGALSTYKKPAAPTPAASSGPPTLVEGARGEQVLYLQTLLARKGYAVGPLDGQFGPMTKSAVSAFQRQVGLQGSGTVGPKTWAALAKPGGEAPKAGPTGTTGPVSQNIAGMLEWAKSMIGTPYAAVNPYRFGEVLWDGKPHTSENGSGRVYNFPVGTRVFDCSGFVVAAYRKLGVDLAQYGMTTSGSLNDNSRGFLQDVPTSDLKPGDLIVYHPSNGIGHVVIYLGDGKTIEAAGSVGVVSRDVNWSAIRSVRRVPL